MNPDASGARATAVPAAVAIGRDDTGWWLRGISDGVAGTPSAEESGAGAGAGAEPGSDASVVTPTRFETAADFSDAVAELERASHPRWVLEGAPIVDVLLRHGVRLARCHDLGLVGRILATRGDTEELAATGGAAALLGTSATPPTAPPPRADEASLFEIDEFVSAPRRANTGDGPESAGDSRGSDAAVARFRRQTSRIDAVGDEGELQLLAAAESSGRLIAAELGAAGVPFDAARHDRILTEILGERGIGGRPDKLEAAAEVVRELLGAPRLNVDSPRDLLAALRHAGLDVRSTSAWELRDHKHPVVEPLVHYKHLARLWTANAWTWRDAWVRAGRLRTEYVPGGVVTGRWATSGGGALQLPREIRAAVVADPGWRLIVSDAAQLEPRILAALSGDERMARAGQARDMYQAFVDAGVVPTRQDAKLGLLGAMYGGTRGRSGELLPALRRAYPQALRFVENAARAGERGEQVATRLGRFSPWPPVAEAEAEAARTWGRFTRNFVVQGTAAEWALAWLARIRQRLTVLGERRPIVDAPLSETPHLVYFLHDEVVVHAPVELADAVAHEVEAAAAWAGRVLFPGARVAFPVKAAVVEAYGDAV